MTESEQQEAWKSLIDLFYDAETLEVRPGCDEFFDDILSMKIAICARLAQTGHEEDALRLWNNITAEQNSSQSSNPCKLDYHPTSNADIDVNRADVNRTNVEISPVAYSSVAEKCIERHQNSSEEDGQRILEGDANTEHCSVAARED